MECLQLGHYRPVIVPVIARSERSKNGYSYNSGNSKSQTYILYNIYSPFFVTAPYRSTGF